MTSPKNGQLPQSDDSQVNEQQKQTRIGTHPQSPNGVFQYDLGLLPEVMIPPSNIEMGHIMGQTVLPYADSYYMAAYAAQPTIYPQVMGIQQAGLHSPNDAVEETVYVNAKQYHGILRRRQSRAKAESEKRAKSRKPYLHESRHLHALRRARGCGGRFLNAKTDQENQMEDTEEANSGGS